MSYRDLDPRHEVSLYERELQVRAQRCGKTPSEIEAEDMRWDKHVSAEQPWGVECTKPDGSVSWRGCGAALNDRMQWRGTRAEARDFARHMNDLHGHAGYSYRPRPVAAEIVLP